MERPAVRAVVVINLLIAAFIVLFWLGWFLLPQFFHARQPGDGDYAAYLAFEGSFPLADGWVALALVLGAVGLRRRRDWGLLFTLLGDGGLLFLWLMDLLYDLRYGMLLPLTGEALMAWAIVIVIPVAAVASIVLAWRERSLSS